MHSFNFKKDIKILVLQVNGTNYTKNITNAIALKNFKNNIVDLSLEKYHLIKKINIYNYIEKENKMQ